MIAQLQKIISERSWRWALLIGLLPCMSLISTVAHAQQMSGNTGVSKPLLLLIVLSSLALLPFVVMMATSFVKIAVVLALIRNALGTQQVPPNTVVTGLAMILSVYIMMPVAVNVYKEAHSVINKSTNQPLLSQSSIEMLIEGANRGKEPVRAFLVKHAHPKETFLFYTLAKRLQSDSVEREKILEVDFLNLVPAFAISELVEAFQIGFVIFLPFLIIDLVIANILLSLGMFQISPVTIALPFKLLLFVLVDGWHLIAKGIILGYV